VLWGGVETQEDGSSLASLNMSAAEAKEVDWLALGGQQTPESDEPRLFVEPRQFVDARLSDSIACCCCFSGTNDSSAPLLGTSRGDESSVNSAAEDDSLSTSRGNNDNESLAALLNFCQVDSTFGDSIDRRSLSDDDSRATFLMTSSTT